MRALLLICLAVSACSKSSTPNAPATPAAPTAALTATFDANPVPFRDSGCSFSTPEGWYTQARVQETAGVAVTVAAFTQKLDGNPARVLSESFNSRFGACSGSTVTPGSIAANGAVCGVVGICTTNTFATYQFSIAGTDANGHAITFDSPLLRLNPR
jgi:hypothetical protein